MTSENNNYQIKRPYITNQPNTMNHPHLHAGRGRVGPVIPGAAPMQHVPPFPGGNNDTTTIQNTESQHNNASASGESDKGKFAVLPDAGSQNLDMSNANQSTDTGIKGTGQSGSTPASGSTGSNTIAVLPNAGSDNLDMSDANTSADTGIQGTGQSASGTNSPPQVGEPSEPVFFPHTGLDRTRPHNVTSPSSSATPETGPVNPSEPAEPVAFPHVGLDRTRPRGFPIRPFAYSSPHTESSQSSVPAKNSASDQTSESKQHHINATDVVLAKSALANKLLPELIEPVLEFAEYFPSKIIGKCDEEKACSSSRKQLYLTARVPDFPAFDSTTEGLGGSGKGRPNRVRKLVFRIKSRDQGWSSNAGRGTYVGSYSWLEVELWRKKETKTTAAANNTSTNTATEASTDTKEHVFLQSASVTADDETEGATQDTDEESRETSNENSEDDGYEKIDGPVLLQRNRHAAREWTEHEIVWDWHKDQLPDSDPDKWEVNGEGWYRDGHYDNGEFVRKLRGGDEIRVILASQFPGWVCRAASCEVELIWAA